MSAYAAVFACVLYPFHESRKNVGYANIVKY